MLGKFGRNIKRIVIILVGLTVIAHLVIIFSVKTKEVKPKRLIRDHEEALCNFRLHRSESKIYQNRQECPMNGIVTIFYAGGLYTQMWSYASVWAVAKVTHLTPFIPICMYNLLSKAFSNFKIPPLTSISECDIPLPIVSQSYESWTGGNQSIVLPVFSRLSEMMLSRLNDFLPEFRPKKNLLEQGERVLRDLRANREDMPVYVGVFLPKNWLSFADGLLYPDVKFFRAVFQQIRKRETNPIFLIVTEDETNQFQDSDDVYFVNDMGTFGFDLALLSLCNISVVGYDDIGIWGALISRGETIVFDDTEDKFEDYLRFLPNWKSFA